MKRILIFTFLISALCVLTACHQVPAFVQNPSMKHLSSSEQRLLADIEKSGIQVIRQGMTFTFVVPTDCFFHHTTHDLYSSREKDLDRLAQFLDYYSRYFASPRITVAGYTDNTWIAPNSNLLALHYAETIATYFQEDGLNPNTILVEGQGSQNTIASNQYPMGTSFNRRVVVTIAYSPALAVVQAQERAAYLAALEKAHMQARLEAKRQAWLKAQQEAQQRAALKAQEQQMAQLKAQQKAIQRAQEKQMAQLKAQQKAAQRAQEEQIAQQKARQEAIQKAQLQAQQRAAAAKQALVEQQQQQQDRLENQKEGMEWQNANRCTGAACNTAPLSTPVKHTQKKLRKKIQSVTTQQNNATSKKTKHSTMGWDDVDHCYGAACM